MKRVFKSCGLLILAAMMLGCTGCNGLQQGTTTTGLLSLGCDIALLEVLKNNPGHVTDVLTTLGKIRDYVNTDISYNDLANKLSEYTTGNYAAEMMIISEYLLSDEPVINSIGLFDGYRAELLERIDRLIKIANMVD